jgi:hypothetical protein
MQMKDADVLAIFKTEFNERIGQVESYAATYGRRTV